MKNFISTSIVAVILTSITAFGQNAVIDKGSRLVLGTSGALSNAYFHIYSPPFEAKAIYNDTIQAVNQFPEQLMSSIISVQTQRWINYNTLGGQAKADKKPQKYFDFIKSMDKDKNYFELKSKFTFTLAGNDFAIIKFYFHTQELPEPKSGAYVMQKQNNRWYQTSNSSTSDIALMIMRFQEEKLLTLLKGSPISNPLMDALIKNVQLNGATDLTLLYKEFSSWYASKDTQRIEYFIDPKSW